jgi:hypothetical protein
MTCISYESYALYEFFQLLVEMLEGKDKLLDIFCTKGPQRFPFPLHAFTFIPNASFFKFCMRAPAACSSHRTSGRMGILQFVFVRPALAVITLTSYFGGHSASSLAVDSPNLYGAPNEM